MSGGSSNVHVVQSAGEFEMMVLPEAEQWWQIELVEGGEGENTENVPLVINLRVER